ncbi:hypothetical protein [Microbacterium stercoris]|uniref:Uncharacterized protein n=1 Tax=Microbacterium stercoris TaxID=2820289 RepID=A0A939QS90_9MICO|nr:hypothetical protein [Microbacterium stercoris]MBO3664193.1 hypothetical protein [Microbacterium stercoris]
MDETHTMVRTEVTVNGSAFLLAQGQDVQDLRRRIEAVGTQARFVEFTVVGNRSVSVLVSSGAQVMFTDETVEYDARDTGDLLEPYGEDFGA